MPILVSSSEEPVPMSVLRLQQQAEPVEAAGAEPRPEHSQPNIVLRREGSQLNLVLRREASQPRMAHGSTFPLPRPAVSLLAVQP